MQIKKVKNFYVPANDIHIQDWEGGKAFTQNKCLEKFKAYCINNKIHFENIIDIGAWVGTWAYAMQNLCEKQIFCYEPDSIHFKCLQKNKLDKVVPIQAAIGAKNDLVSLSEDNFTQAKRISGEGKIKMITLDSCNHINIDLIKIDVEGYEMEVLKGAVKTLKRVKYIMIELNNNTKKYGSSNNQIERYLRKIGYRPLLNHWPDKVFVKK